MIKRKAPEQGAFLVLNNQENILKQLKNFHFFVNFKKIKLTMKKILFLAVSAAFVFSSCSNNDDDDNSVNIVGVWRPSKTLKISGSNGSIISTENSSTCNKKSTYEFKANNELTNHIFENDSDGCTDFGSQTAPYSYDMNNKKIVIDGDSYDVAKHTSNEIQIVVDYGQFNSDNIEDHMILVLTK